MHFSYGISGVGARFKFDKCIALGRASDDVAHHSASLNAATFAECVLQCVLQKDDNLLLLMLLISLPIFFSRILNKFKCIFFLLVLKTAELPHLFSCAVAQQI